VSGGIAFQQQPSAPLTAVTGSSPLLLPTPNAADRNPARETHARGNPTLLGAMRLLPTPKMRDGDSRGHARAKGSVERGGGMSTEQALKLLPTPNATLANYSEEPDRWMQRPKHKTNPRATVGQSSMPLPVALKLLPTPRASENDQGPSNQRAIVEARSSWLGQHRGATLTTAVKAAAWQSSGASSSPRSGAGRSSTGLRLSPWFVEWMIGAPHGWSDPDCPLSATEFSSTPASCADGGS
jgi:hypothetical protein